MVSDRKYIDSKIAHMKRMGINAGISERGAAQPDWAKTEADERRDRHARMKKRREWVYHEDEEG